jgi:class 3 adenylate cyclase
MADEHRAERALGKRIGTLGRDFAALLFLWHQRREPGCGWVAAPGIYAQLSHAFIELGSPLVGLEVAEEGLEVSPGDVALRQVRGLALARSGNTEAANGTLEQLRAEGHLDDETLGVLARTHKDLALVAGDALRREHLKAALNLYADAYARSASYWTGINVATLAALQGDRERSAAVAAQVVTHCKAELERLSADDVNRYWILATLGEAALSTGDFAGAERWYRQAGEVGRLRFGDVSSTRRHALLLVEHHGGDANIVDQWLPLPRVVLFSGHMLDQPGRAQPRFPASLESPVYAAIRDWLSGNNGLIGISSAACGADLLFLEAVHELGGETHILLPYDRDEFVEDSIETAGSGQWRERFERQLERSQVVYASSSRPLDAGLAYDYANRLIHGLGLVRARELGTQLVALAVWNGQSGDGRGGAASAVRQWQQNGVTVHRVRIEAPSEGIDVERLPSSPAAAFHDAAAGVSPNAIMSLLFADVVGFSRLTDAELAAFVEAFLPLVARLIDESRASVPVRETWGDALFLAFSGPGAAGLFALNLRDAMATVDWQGLGFSRPLTMRFALHAGPVHLTTDPITGLPKCCGAHVSRAARLEPKTPPGQVYASEAFAALAELDDTAQFRCDYVKQLDWAKRYGTFPAYIVRRR